MDLVDLVVVVHLVAVKIQTIELLMVVAVGVDLQVQDLVDNNQRSIKSIPQFSGMLFISSYHAS
jgi:myo-inositol catabolism protein IolC